jgi:hypothetical protein
MFFILSGLPYLLFATLLCMSGLTGSNGRHELALYGRFLITQGRRTIFYADYRQLFAIPLRFH